jgi:hypothetical protein
LGNCQIGSSKIWSWVLRDLDPWMTSLERPSCNSKIQTRLFVIEGIHYKRPAITPCGSCRNWRFGGTYGLHNQSDANRRARNNVSMLRRNTVFPQKCRFLQEPHGVTSQKGAFFIVNAMTTSNLT